MRRHADMEQFWDERAAEDALYYVDNRLKFGQPHVEERFWAEGQNDLDLLLDTAGARVEPGDELVEIGCGVGRLTRVLASRAAHVRAIDVSSEMLQRARELNPGLENVEWIHGDGISLGQIETESADGCVSHVVFQHVPDPQITLGYVREMGRILRPGGWSAFQVSTDPSVHSPSFGTRVRNRLRSLLSRGPKGVTNKNWLGSAVSLDELESTARAAHLEVAQVTGAGTQYCVVRLVRPAA